MKKILLSFCVVLLLSSCKEEVKIPANFDYGKIENGSYDNKFFNFKLAFNDQWSVQTKEQMHQMSENSRNTMAGDNHNLKNTLKASQVNVADLFSIFKFPVGSVSGGNASLIINAENLMSFPNVKTPRDYMVAARQLLDQTSLNLIYKKEPYTITIGGKQCIGMEIFNQDYNLTQDYFVTLRNGFAISMVLSYDNAEDQQELYKMLDTLKFE
ncbi:hypothetical protein [Gelidibacter sp.]|uniref:hypothetical protein n=1 Tax=Gelidibacter sp. TaxID=2018083 RepID=UPI002D1C3A7B|nr:hypothetical protein [Gelidibacter sp.]HUH27340.1 hypothetical protein [Gelidibacter sp.]